MTVHPDDLFDLLKKMRMDLTQLQARVTDLSKMLAALKLEEPKGCRCELCAVDFPNELSLLDHSALIHGINEEARERAHRLLEERAV